MGFGPTIGGTNSLLPLHPGLVHSVTWGKDLNIYVYVYGTVSAMKTTVLLREDLYEILKKRYGPRRISEAINAILAEALLKGEGMFGTMPRTSLKDLRDHRDRI